MDYDGNRLNNNRGRFVADFIENDGQALSGRLELNWTNKHKRLLAHEDESYEWTNPSDYRVAEVRLLHDVGTVGEVNPNKQRAADNLLIRGDALHVLTSLEHTPEFAREYAGKVRLVYIDPPFNTGQMFNNYNDALEHSVWLTMFRDRLLQLRRLMSEDGSIWVHLDDVESHRARCVLDEVFGAENFVANIIWQKSHTRENRTDISTTHDNIIVYAVNRGVWKSKRNLLPSSEDQIARYSNPDNDPRGVWASLPLHAKAEAGRRASQFYTITTPSGRAVDPPAGRCWLYTAERLKEMVADNRVWFGESGNNAPRGKKFLSEVQTGLVPTSIWLYQEVGTTGTAKDELLRLLPEQTPFSTPKPERLMERIIQVATNEGDIVLDCFAGSGTTAAVAHKMNRRWVTSEWSRDNTENYILPRLTKVIEGTDLGGITESQGWEGGGGFRVLEVAPSMFDVQDGRIVLAPWATDEALAEAVAAQAGFDYTPEDVPFCGRKGRQRLAVIDGLVNPDVAALLTAWLGDNEVLVVYGTAVDPDTRQALTTLRRGSQCRKVPQTLLNAYRRAASRDTMFTPAPSMMSEGEGK